MYLLFIHEVGHLYYKNELIILSMFLIESTNSNVTVDKYQADIPKINVKELLFQDITYAISTKNSWKMYPFNSWMFLPWKFIFDNYITTLRIISKQSWVVGIVFDPLFCMWQMIYFLLRRWKISPTTRCLRFVLRCVAAPGMTKQHTNLSLY